MHLSVLSKQTHRLSRHRWMLSLIHSHASKLGGGPEMVTDFAQWDLYTCKVYICKEGVWTLGWIFGRSFATPVVLKVVPFGCSLERFVMVCT